MTAIQSEDNPEASEPSEPSASTPSIQSGKSTVIKRCILFGILIVAVIVLIMDRKARSDSYGFYDTLDKAIDKSQIMNHLDVKKLAGRQPAETSRNTSGKKEYFEEYRWRGGFRTYTVYCSYQVAAEKLLNTVSYNQPLN